LSSEAPIVSIVIPTFEEKRLGNTLRGLFKQSYIEKCEIILADYDPKNNKIVQLTAQDFPVVYFKVARKGIAYARHLGILMSKCNCIINFDADAHYHDIRDIEKMVSPILTGECMITTCDNEFDFTELKKEQLAGMSIPQLAVSHLNYTQRVFPIACLEPGSAMNKKAYEMVGGFNDIEKHELFHLSHRIVYRYMRASVRNIQDVKVIVSARRAFHFMKEGVSALNYGQAYR
jgi:glycosyltransferase involved in cell wall biosynthesis